MRHSTRCFTASTWLGVAAAFSYFAVFGGGTVLPLLAGDSGPKEIVTNYSDARPSNSSQTSMVSAGSSEKFDSRWPADNQEPPKTSLISSDPSTRRPAVPIARAASAAPAVASPAVMAPSIPASLLTLLAAPISIGSGRDRSSQRNTMPFASSTPSTIRELTRPSRARRRSRNGCGLGRSS